MALINPMLVTCVARDLPHGTSEVKIAVRVRPVRFLRISNLELLEHPSCRVTAPYLGS